MGGKVASAFLRGCVPGVDDTDNSSQETHVSQQSVQSSSRPPFRPIARHIALNIIPADQDSDDDQDIADFRGFHNLFGDAFQVTTFTIEHAVPSYQLPLFSSGKLKSIQIDEPRIPGYSTPIGRVLDILTQSPDLHVFVLSGNKSGRRTVDTPANRAEIRLPHLRILSLQSIDIPTILSHITVPSLEKLKLGNELGARWEGCIADSLRAMILRSDYPPITRYRINEMSTPNPSANNAWECFDVMPHLQSFRCHHTHFPDALLASLNEFGEGKNICPRLSKLVFENCDFTGSALVKFVVGRRDRARSKRDVADLQELWVGGCERVNDAEKESLTRLLGGKFQPSLQAGV